MMDEPTRVLRQKRGGYLRHADRQWRWWPKADGARSMRGTPEGDWRRRFMLFSRLFLTRLFRVPGALPRAAYICFWGMHAAYAGLETALPIHTGIEDSESACQISGQVAYGMYAGPGYLAELDAGAPEIAPPHASV